VSAGTQVAAEMCHELHRLRTAEIVSAHVEARAIYFALRSQSGTRRWRVCNSRCLRPRLAPESAPRKRLVDATTLR